MDERVERLKTPEECEQFALNVRERLPELAEAAVRKAVELRAAKHGAKTPVEREALEAVYAYERVLSKQRGWYVPATYTWRMIKNRGILPTLEHLVSRKDDA